MESLCTGMLGWLVVVLSTCSSGRLPLPIRVAHRLENTLQGFSLAEGRFSRNSLFYLSRYVNQPSPQLFLGHNIILLTSSQCYWLADDYILCDALQVIPLSDDTSTQRWFTVTSNADRASMLCFVPLTPCLPIALTSPSSSLHLQLLLDALHQHQN